MRCPLDVPELTENYDTLLMYHVNNSFPSMYLFIGKNS